MIAALSCTDWDAREQNLRVGLAAREPSRVDAGRRVRPDPQEFAVVLSDEFPYMRGYDDTGPRPRCDDLLDQRRHDEALAASRRHLDQGMTALLFRQYR